MLSICVFCGSSPGQRPDYAAAAGALGSALAEGGHRLIYGGASVGLMGLLADAALAGGAEVLGVLPEQLVEREIDHPRLSSMERVSSMAERKERMIELADAFIALPGGVGTLDEIFEVLCGRLIAAHDKPLGLLDVAGYWPPLAALLERGVAEGFIPAELSPLPTNEDPRALLDELNARVRERLV
jgi:uncharacterized protein (TIGR00730 family)